MGVELKTGKFVETLIKSNRYPIGTGQTLGHKGSKFDIGSDSGVLFTVIGTEG